MSYPRNTERFFYAPNFLESNSEHFSQPGVEWKWQEVVRFMKSVRFDPKATDPTDPYADVPGGLRFDSVQNRFRYRNATIWKYFGDGDGDVKYDDTGPTAKSDTAIPRWTNRADGNWIEGSLVTISDTGAMLNPERYTSRNGTLNATAFMAETAPNNFDLRIYNDGRIKFNDDVTLDRPSTGYVTLDGADTRLGLTGTGNTRMESRKFLGNIGNSTVTNNVYRAPVLFETVGVVQSAAFTSTAGAIEGETAVHTLVVPGNALSNDGDSIEWTVVWDAGSTAFTKALVLTFAGNDIINTIAGGTTYAGQSKIQICRLNSTSIYICMNGIYELAVMGSGTSRIFDSSVDFTLPLSVSLKLRITGDGLNTPVAAGQLTHDFSRIVYYNR